MRRFALVLVATMFAGPVTGNTQQQPVDRSGGGNAQDGGASQIPDAGSVPSPSTVINGNSIHDSVIRGDPQSGSTSDKETSRTWSGIGSTGGGTGTGTSSGVAQEPPPAHTGTGNAAPSQR